MAVRTWDDSRLLRQALIASLAAHLLVALFLPPWIPAQSPGLQPVEAVSFARITRVEIRRPVVAAPPVALPQTTHRAPTVTFARHKSELSAHTRKPSVRPTAVEAPAGKVAAAPRRVMHRRPAPLYARAPASAEPVSASSGSAVQTPQPETTVAPQIVAASGIADRGGALPLGASQDPVLDPNVRAQLQRRFALHVTLLVTVGEDGHTERVVFQPAIDPAIEQQIESILASANWDAAVCGGGVTCEGTATIKL